MSPNGHDTSAGLLDHIGSFEIRAWDMHMGWETIAPQHESSCFAWGLEFVYWDYATQHCALRSYEIVFLEVVFFTIASPRLSFMRRATQASY
jgi:hypothetical protein